MLALCCVLTALCVLAISTLLSPGTFSGKSYSFLHYSKYVELPDTATYSFDKDTKEDKAKEDLYNKLIAKAQVKKIPKKQLQNEQKIIETQYQVLANNYAMSYNDLIESFGYKTSDWNKHLKKASKEAALWKLICYAYAREHNISLNRDGYKSYKMTQFKTFGITKSAFKKVYGKSYDDFCDANNMYSDYVRDEVTKDLYKNAKATAITKKKTE